MLDYVSLVPSLSARQIFIAYSMKNRRGKFDVTDKSRPHELRSRTALSKAFTDTPTAIYRRKGTYLYV